MITPRILRLIDNTSPNTSHLFDIFPKDTAIKKQFTYKNEPPRAIPPDYVPVTIVDFRNVYSSTNFTEFELEENLHYYSKYFYTPLTPALEQIFKELITDKWEDKKVIIRMHKEYSTVVCKDGTDTSQKIFYCYTKDILAIFFPEHLR